MMPAISLGQLITPNPGVQHPNPAATEALGALADAAIRQKQFDQNLALQQDKVNQESASEAEKYAIQRDEVAGKNRYYDAQAETHRMAAENAADDRKNKQISALEVAFRKARTPEERNLVIQAMQRAGLQHQEVDTDLPEAPGAAQAPAPKPAGPDLGQEGPSTMGFYGGQNEPVDAGASRSLTEAIRGAASEGTGPGDVDSPFPWEMLGLSAPKPAAPAAPEKPKRGGKHIITDQQGNPVIVYDEPLEKEKGRAQMEAALTPLIGEATSPEEKGAGQKAVGVAQGYFESTGDKAGALKFGQDVYKATLAQFKKKLPGAGGGGGEAGPSKADMKLAAMGNEAANKIRDDVSRDYSFKAAVGSEDDAKRGLTFMDQLDSGFGDAAAFGSFLNDLSGKVVSDKERSFYLGSEGFWTEMAAKVAKYTDGGRLPPELMTELRKRFQATVSLAEERRARAAQQARQTALHTPGAEDAADMLEGYFSGNWKEPTASRLKPKAKSAAAPAAAAPNAGKGKLTPEQEARKKALLGE